MRDELYLTVILEKKRKTLSENHPFGFITGQSENYFENVRFESAYYKWSKLN